MGAGVCRGTHGLRWAHKRVLVLHPEPLVRRGAGRREGAQGGFHHLGAGQSFPHWALPGPGSGTCLPRYRGTGLGSSSRGCRGVPLPAHAPPGSLLNSGSRGRKGGHTAPTRRGRGAGVPPSPSGNPRGATRGRRRPRSLGRLLGLARPPLPPAPSPAPGVPTWAGVRLRPGSVPRRCPRGAPSAPGPRPAPTHGARLRSSRVGPGDPECASDSLPGPARTCAAKVCGRGRLHPRGGGSGGGQRPLSPSEGTPGAATAPGHAGSSALG